MSDNKNLEKKIDLIVAEKLGIDCSMILPDTKLFEDLGIDEIKLVEIIIALETQLNCDIPDESIEVMEKIVDLHKSVIKFMKHHER